MYIKNAIKHFKLITHHKWLVFKLCCKIGEPWRGFMHDWSKYSPTEFFESVKYYQGTYSPIKECKRINGYSEAWLHHKGRNKHHAEYWFDEAAPQKNAIMPYKYAAEMICDKIAAGMAYEGKNFTKEYELEYWKKEKEIINVNEHIAEFVTDILNRNADKVLNPVINKKNLNSSYKKYCE